MVCLHLKLIVAIMLRILLTGRGGVSETNYYYNRSKQEDRGDLDQDGNSEGGEK